MQLSDKIVRHSYNFLALGLFLKNFVVAPTIGLLFHIKSSVFNKKICVGIHFVRLTEDIGPFFTKHIWSHSDYEVGGQCMCKEMSVIPVDRVVDNESIIGKMEG
jgi:hypothetical protein